jgi:hypothetical protein
MHELGDMILFPNDGVSCESTGAYLAMISGKERVLRESSLSWQARGGRVQWSLGWAGEINMIAFGVEERFRLTRGTAPPSHGVIAIVLHILKVVPPCRRNGGWVPQELHIQILHEREVGEKR